MQLKKILAIFLAAALMLFSLATTASAENTEIFKVEVEALTTTSTLSSSPIIYTPGEEFTVKISASQNTGITSVMFLIDYDETVLEVVPEKCKATKLFTKNDELTAGTAAAFGDYFSFYSDNYPNISTATGTFVELTFVAKEVCAKDSAVTVSLFQNSAGFCTVQTVSGLKIVPFESESNTFSIHDLDTETKVVTPVKCLEDGYTTYSCKACKESVVGNIVPYTGHTEKEAVAENYVAATCTKEGSYDLVVYCETCNTELSREGHTIDMKEHVGAEAVEENRVESTCTAEGNYDMVVYCKDCNKELSRESFTIDVKQHIGAEAVEENRVESTCNKVGSYDMVVYCKDCNKELSRDIHTIDMKQHIGAEAVEENRVESTCTAEGSYDLVVYCKDCNKELSREAKVIAKKQHTPGAAKQENVKDATCTAEGSYDEVVYCSGCNEKLSSTAKTIEKKAHTWGEATVVAPEYQKEGYTTHTCSVCKTEEKYDIVPALTYILGDVDGNETIDDSDAIYLLYATLGMEGYELNQTSDFNGDGEVTDADAIHLLYYTLLGAEEFPLADVKEAK